MLAITSLVQSVQAHERVLLARALHLICKAAGRRKLWDHVFVPTSLKEFRQYCTHNKLAVGRGLPRELVHVIAKHACIRLSDKLNHIMGHGIGINFYDTHEPTLNTGLNASKAMKQLVQRLKRQQ